MKFEINDVFLTDDNRERLLTDYIPRLEKLGATEVTVDASADARKWYVHIAYFGSFRVALAKNGESEPNKAKALEGAIEELHAFLSQPALAPRLRIPELNRMVVLVNRSQDFRPNLIERKGPPDRPGRYMHPGALIDGLHTLQ